VSEHRAGRDVTAPAGAPAPGSIAVQVEVLSWVNRLVGGPGTGEVTLEERVPRGTTVRAALARVSERFPELGRALWDPAHPRELGDNIEVLVGNAVLGVTHDLDSEILDGERITLLGQYMGG
jgi:molybdopterin converting factor small subunit